MIFLLGWLVVRRGIRDTGPAGSAAADIWPRGNRSGRDCESASVTALPGIRFRALRRPRTAPTDAAAPTAGRAAPATHAARLATVTDLATIADADLVARVDRKSVV